MRTTLATKIWLGLGAVLVGLLIGAVLLWARVFSGPAGEANLAAAQKAYAAGKAAFEAEQFPVAVERCGEADRLAAQAIVELANRRKNAKTDDEKIKLIQLEGEGFWVKAQAMRDRFFAEKAEAGEPLVSILDTTLGNHFRSPLYIQDDKIRNECVLCQRLAFQRLPHRADVVLDTMRNEVILNPMDWAMIEAVARATLEIDPKDSRALYLLARIDVDQIPSDGKGPSVPIPEEKRSRERLLKAREYLSSPGAEKIPPFRRIYLEAQLAKSFRDMHNKVRKQKEREMEDRKLVELVVDLETSELARAMKANPEGKDLSTWDKEAILGSYTLAVERLLEDLARGEGDETAVVQLLDRVTAHALGLARRDDDRGIVEKAALTAIQATERAQPLFADRIDSAWSQQVDSLPTLMTQVQEKKFATSTLCDNLSRLLGREGNLEIKRGNVDQGMKLKTLAGTWLEQSNKLRDQPKPAPTNENQGQ